MTGFLLFISGQEMVIIALVILLLFGSKKIPEMARGLGKGLREFRKAADDIKREINENAPDVAKELKDIKKDIKDSTDEMTRDLRDFRDDITKK